MHLKSTLLGAFVFAAAIAASGCSSSSSSASTTCPTQTPTNGEGCSLASGTKCTYGCESTPGIATCNGTWTVQLIGTVCPPPDAGGDGGACPATMPASGGVCVSGTTCTYDCSNEGPNHETGTATCNGSTWTVQLTGIVCLDGGGD
jgi:hypothetical protein